MNAVKGWLVFSISGLLSFSAINAWADCCPPPPCGWYINGNFGNTNQSEEDYGSGTSTSTKNAGFGLNINAGYQFFPYFALEAGYTRYSRIDISFHGDLVAKNDPSAWDVTTKAILPIQDSGFRFFAKLGVGRITSHIVITDQPEIDANGLSISGGNTSATGVLFGGGGEYFFWGNAGLTASWIENVGNKHTGNMSLTTLGLIYLFG